MDKAELKDVVQQLFSLADKDGSGSIEFSEFLLHHGSIMSLSADTMRQAGVDVADDDVETRFREHDLDHNQLLDKDDFASYMHGVFSITGKKAFMKMCKTLISREQRRRNSSALGYDWRFGERLIDQAKSANYYKPQMKEAALRFLDSKADPNHLDYTGAHVLLYAAEKADDAFVRTLLNVGADPKIHNKEMECAAFKAARAHKMDVLRALLLHGKTDEQDVKNSTMLTASIELVGGMPQIDVASVRELLKKKADVNYKSDMGWTALTAAASWGKKDCLQLMLRPPEHFQLRAPRLHRRNKQGLTALHLAAIKGHHELVPLLIRAKSDPNVLDSDGWTSLHHAAFNGGNEVVSQLIEASANLYVRGKNGLTPLMAAKHPSHAGKMTEGTMKKLEVPEDISYAKAIVPVLKDESLPPNAKLRALLNLPGVNGGPQNLRLSDHFFHPGRGPNEVRLKKVWESLILPIIENLQIDGSDLESRDSAAYSDDASINRQKEEQSNFLHQWLVDTKGPRASPDWKHDNRACFKHEFEKARAEGLKEFEQEFEKVYTRYLSCADGEALAAMPAKEDINSAYDSQLDAHPLPVWLEKLDPIGAFEALRQVGVDGFGLEDEDSLASFVDLLNLHRDFRTGKDFWKNIYRLWLCSYAKLANAEFQSKVTNVVSSFNDAHCKDTVNAVHRGASIKSYERIKLKERRFGTPSHSTYAGRTAASSVLDVVRCSITVATPHAAMILLNDYFKPLRRSTDKMEVVHIENRFSRQAETSFGYRNIELSLLLDAGVKSSACGRKDVSLKIAMIGEVQIVLQDYLLIHKRRHLLHKSIKGEFDWVPDDLD